MGAGCDVRRAEFQSLSTPKAVNTAPSTPHRALAFEVIKRAETKYLVARCRSNRFAHDCTPAFRVRVARWAGTSCGNVRICRTGAANLPSALKGLLAA